MKELSLQSTIKVCSYNELIDSDKILVDKAKKATNNSYAPYSKFNVGAAVSLKNGEIITGTNQENAAYPSGLCAERTSIFYANSKFPESPIQTLAIAAKNEEGFLAEPISPCGSCRQVILESENRHKTPIRIILYGEEYIYIINSITDILPLSFSSSSLK